MSVGSISVTPSPSTSIPTWITSNELHQVDHHLPVGVAHRDRPRPRRGRFGTFQRPVNAVAVLIDATAGIRETQHRPVGSRDDEPAQGTEALSHLADSDRGKPVAGELRPEGGRREVLVRASASPGENDRPATGRLGSGRQVQGEVNVGVSLDRRSAGQCSDSRNVLARMYEVVRRDVPPVGEGSDRT